MPGRFVGREQEMAALTGLLSRLDARSGPVAALVLGAPGAGKTRLLTELRAHVDVVEQVWLRGFELEAGIPLATARSLLHRLRDVPGLGGTIGAFAFGSGDDVGVVDEVRLFEAVHQARSAVGPMLVVVDDLHWADGLTTSLLHYTVRAAHDARAPLAVVAASRPSGRARALRESLAELLGIGFTELVLEPLTEEAGTRMAQDLAPHLGVEQAAGVWRRSGGSPFWLALLASGHDGAHDVDRLVGERLDQAGPDGSAVVTLLTVTGHPVTVEDAQCALGWPADRLEDAVARLEQVGLVARSRSALDLAHDLIRDAAGRAADAVQARQLHRTWGRCVEGRAGDDETALLEALDHLRSGGEDVTPLASRLARSRRRRLLGRPGLETLLSVAEETPSEAGDRLAAELGEMAAELGAHDVALRIWSQRPSFGRPDREVAYAALQAATAATALSLGAEARAHLDRARVHAAADPVLTTEVLAQESVIQRYTDGDPATSRTTAARALATIRPHLVPAGDGDTAAAEATRRAWLRAALAATEGALTSDDPQQMLALADELAAAATGVDDRVEVQALTEGAMALRFLGRNPDAEARLRHAWDLCHRRLLPESTLQVGTTLARVLLSLGRLDEAAELVRECRAVGHRVSAVTPMRAFGVTLAWSLEASTGSWRAAVEGLRAAAGEEDNPHFRLQAHLERATTVSRLDPQGGGAEVRECVSAALEDADAAGCRRCRTESLLRCAQGLARIGSLDDAHQLAAGASVNAADQYLQFWTDWTAATVRLAGGEPSAVGSLWDVVDGGERQGLRLESLWVRLDLASALLDVDRDRAREVLADVCTTAERMGAATELRVAGRMLRGQGVRAWRRGARVDRPDRLGSLTARELEIARLVATGASNPEIAEAVFLSRRTVEHHVSNVLAKLGLRNRGELTAMVAEEHPSPRGTG